MTKVDLADMISEEAQKQKSEPKETLGSKVDKTDDDPSAEPELKDKKKPAPRRTAWLREDHLDRLEVLKRRDASRLRADPDKRVAVTSLIDEAIEMYLAEME